MLKVAVFIFSCGCLMFALFFRDLILPGLIFFVIGTAGIIYFLKKIFE